MRPRTDIRVRALAVALAVASLAVLAGAASASQNTVTQVSIGALGGNAATPTQWSGASADGTRVFLRTMEPLAASDTDTRFDIYERTAAGATTQISIGPAGGNLDTAHAEFEGSSADGTRVFFSTFEPLVASDTDECDPEDPLPNGCGDVYQYENGVVTLASAGGNGGFGARFEGTSADGTRLFFSTREPMSGADSDTARDIYQRSGGTTSLVSAGSTGGNGSFDATFRGSSADGTRVFFTTSEPLVAGDTDSSGDVYERAGGVTTLLSTGTAGGNGANDASFRGASSDGSRVFLETTEKLVASDTDSAVDVYERAGGATTLLSTGPSGGNGAQDALLKAWSEGGTRTFFQTTEQLTGTDTDSALDVYERSSGTTTLASTGPAGGNGSFDALLQDVSADGSRVVIGTREGLVASDTDGRFDIYERTGGATTLVSTGPAGGNGNYDAFFSGASKDGGRVFFETGEQLASDSDSLPDVYERTSGTTTKISQGSPDANGAQGAFFVGSSEDGTRVWYASAEKLVSTDTDSGTDVFEIRELATYPRPKGATPLKIALVPAFEACSAPNRIHGPPTIGPGANDPSCNPPVPASAQLTVGTPDSNGAPAKSSGFVRLAAIVGNPGTQADEADVAITLDLADVRRRSGLADYTGELLATMPMRLIDKYSGTTPVDAATMTDFTASFPASCTATADTTVGASCAASTTADALVPGMVVEGARAIWQLGRVEVFDGGADDIANTSPNTPFMRQGIFIP
jgi:hypothetical protein